MTAPLRRPVVAPLGRMLGAELTLALTRPRTVVVLGATALLPVLVAIGMLRMDETETHAIGVLMVSASELAAFSAGLPVVLVAADALAAERARGTLDLLRLAPVGVTRLLVLKTGAVVATAALAATILTVAALIAGLLVLGPGPMGTAGTLGRGMLTALWLTGQLAALGAGVLAVSAATRRPTAAVASGLVVVTIAPLAGMLWRPMAPLLPTGHWTEVMAQVCRSSVGLSAAGSTTLRAAGFAVAGLGLAAYLLARHDG
ncbi:ABC transporter permease [Pseudonocardia phyllosphaerae]|uniref:ABC transporter permease n=1 Tax=Pseudonocardia phyllosphaerae TaxID=3390502 RepID=UPI00397E8E40